MLPRRAFLTGLVSALAAPAIVHAELIMPVRKIIMPPVVLAVGKYKLTLDGVLWMEDADGQWSDMGHLFEPRICSHVEHS